MPHVIIAGAIHDSGIKLIKKRQDFTFTYLPENGDLSYKDLILDADALVLRTQRLNSQDIIPCKKLKIVSRHGVGYDSVDVEALSKNNIVLTIVGDVNSQSVAEHSMALILAAFKRLIRNDEAVRVGPWNYKEKLEPEELRNKTLLIIGYGRVGRRLAKMAYGFDMKVVAYDPFVDHADWPEGPALKIVDLKSALETSHCISLNLPKLTNPIIKEEEFLIMKEGMVIINTARGGLIDEKALINALETGKVAAAGLDVFDQEPPLLESPFAKFKQVVLSPHVAGLSSEAAEGMAISSIKNVLDYFDGNLESHFIINK